MRLSNTKLQYWTSLNTIEQKWCSFMGYLFDQHWRYDSTRPVMLSIVATNSDFTRTWQGEVGYAFYLLFVCTFLAQIVLSSHMWRRIHTYRYHGIRRRVVNPIAYICGAHPRFAHSQLETALLCNSASHWLGASHAGAKYAMVFSFECR